METHRILHDYGFYKRGSHSVNATHSCTSVKYLSFKQTVIILADVHQLIKADLESGFHQFGTHPVDQRFQVYCNGPYEHYIDLACPYGKTNSPLEFCPQVSLFAKSVCVRYGETSSVAKPKLGTYMDDIFGGLRQELSYARALHLRNYICSTGKRLTITFNMSIKKTPLPATAQIILGRH